jgi:hypothetical protein
MAGITTSYTYVGESVQLSETRMLASLKLPLCFKRFKEFNVQAYASNDSKSSNDSKLQTIQRVQTIQSFKRFKEFNVLENLWTQTDFDLF